MLNLQLPFRSPFSRSGPASPQLSDDMAMLVQQIQTKYAIPAKEGRLFIGNAGAAGQVLPIFSATAQKFGIWNPAGSGVNAILVEIAMTYIDATPAAGGYVLAVSRNAGSALATGGISAFTAGTPDNALTGKTGGNAVRFTPSAATVLAPVIYRHLGINQDVAPATSAVTPARAKTGVLFDGDVVVQPNTALWLCGNISTIAKWASMFAWIEEPV